jgi:hypothetical protein
MEVTAARVRGALLIMSRRAALTGGVTRPGQSTRKASQGQQLHGPSLLHRAAFTWAPAEGLAHVYTHVYTGR